MCTTVCNKAYTVYPYQYITSPVLMHINHFAKSLTCVTTHRSSVTGRGGCPGGRCQLPSWSVRRRGSWSRWRTRTTETATDTSSTHQGNSLDNAQSMSKGLHIGRLCAPKSIRDFSTKKVDQL